VNIDSFLLRFILHSIRQLNGARSQAGLANILYGKRNHQTWIDMHHLQLQSSYKFLEKEEAALLDEALLNLMRFKLIERRDESIFLTSAGISYLENENPSAADFYERDGRVIGMMNRFWSGLHLLVQTLSNLLQGNRKFLPAVREERIQEQVKRWVGKYGIVRGARGIKEELRRLISQFSPLHQELLLLRLSGHHRVSLTFLQLSRRLGYSYWRTKWEWERALSLLYHQMLQTEFHYLSDLMSSDSGLYSASSRKTWLLLQKNLSVAEISQIRGLKESTIMDHIVEIALMEKDFPFSSFLTENELREVEEVKQKTGFTRLREFKERLPHLSYFQIRLALTLLGVGVSHGVKHIT
jgi:uncharacterized protein YpbB